MKLHDLRYALYSCMLRQFIRLLGEWWYGRLSKLFMVDGSILNLSLSHRVLKFRITLALIPVHVHCTHSLRTMLCVITLDLWYAYVLGTAFPVVLFAVYLFKCSWRLLFYIENIHIFGMGVCNQHPRRAVKQCHPQRTFPAAPLSPDLQSPNPANTGLFHLYISGVALYNVYSSFYAT